MELDPIAIRKQAEDEEHLYSKGLHDQILMKRLHDANMLAPYPMRLNLQQAAAVTGFSKELFAEGGLGDGMSWLAGFAYGFQIAHDLVAKHGPIMEVSNGV